MDKKATFFTRSNLILISTVGALYHMSLSLLRFFFGMIFFDYIDIVLCTLILVFAAFYALKARPSIALEKDVFLLLIMLIYLLISCVNRTIVSGEDWLSSNSGYMVDLEVLIMIYILGKYYAKNGIPAYLMNIFHGIIISWSAVILFLLVNVFTNHLVTAPSGATLCSMDSLFFVLNVNRNHTGAYSGVFLLLSLCMLTWCQNRRIRIFYYPAILINYVLLVLSSSKTALLSTTIGFALIIGLLFFTHWNTFDAKKRFSLSAIISILSGVFFFLLRYPVIALYSTIVTHFSGEELPVREILDSSAATLSGRLPIWKISVKFIFTGRFLLCGVTPLGIFKDIAEAKGEEPRGLNTHNQFLEVGTTMGLPALIAFIIWSVLILVACWKVYQIKKDELGLLLIPMLLVAFAVMSMAEAYLMFYSHFVAYVFFFICGIIYAKSDLKFKPLFTIKLDK